LEQEKTHQLQTVDGIEFFEMSRRLVLSAGGEEKGWSSCFLAVRGGGSGEEKREQKTFCFAKEQEKGGEGGKPGVRRKKKEGTPFYPDGDWALGEKGGKPRQAGGGPKVVQCGAIDYNRLELFSVVEKQEKKKKGGKTNDAKDTGNRVNLEKNRGGGPSHNTEEV